MSRVEILLCSATLGDVDEQLLKGQLSMGLGDYGHTILVLYSRVVPYGPIRNSCCLWVCVMGLSPQGPWYSLSRYITKRKHVRIDDDEHPENPLASTRVKLDFHFAR